MLHGEVGEYIKIHLIKGTERKCRFRNYSWRKRSIHLYGCYSSYWNQLVFITVCKEIIVWLRCKGRR